MNTLLVTSTADGTGKTAITIALARLAQDRGATVGYMKPKGTRLQSVTGKTRDEDPMLAKELLGLEAEMHEMEPVVYSPTFVEQAIRGREDPTALRERITGNFEDLAAETDLMVVEGSRLWTGGIVDLTDAAVADLLDARTLLVTRYRDPVDVDDVLAAADDLGDRLAGVLFNVVPEAAYDTLAEDVMPFLEGRGVPPAGAITRDDRLAGVSVADLAESLGAEVLTDEASTDTLVERFTVGAMGSSSALEYFRRARNAVVITGGDRPDVQRSALEAAGVKCLLLTGGYRPPGALLGKAEEVGVPVLLVDGDTRATIDRTESVIHAGRTRSRETVDRMETLLTEAVDVDDLLDLPDSED
jgi:BioD-like phosphotransacetylase family protein